MRDELVRLHLKNPNLLAVGVLCSNTARHACQLHHCLPTAAGLFSQAVAAGLGIAGLLGGQARINLQVTCDGPLKGLLVDADAAGAVRGYVRNPSVNFLSPGAAFESGAALGGSGVLSILRELKAGDFYRGSIALEHFDLARDLERFYRESEQIETLVRIDVRSMPAPGDASVDSAASVAAALVQLMPGAARGALDEARTALGEDLPQASRAIDLVRPLIAHFGGDFDLQSDYPLAFRCSCSMEKVLGAVLTMGRAELQDMLEKDGRAIATCAFCNTVYEISDEQLEALLEQIDRDAGAPNLNEPN